MCGIVGLFLKKDDLRPRLGDMLTDMLITMTDRGPDSAGIAIYGAGPVGLMAAHSAEIRGASQIFVVDSHDDRLKLAEAMGAIPIDMRKGDPAQQILDATGGGLLCPPEDPAALADALLELLNDPAHATRLGERGRAAVRDRFTSRRMAQQVAEICQGLASSTTS